uniref:Globin domain-containing protein n=1 Tax=Oncorhynchus tshawytscha TaxID=74940 RepID=A0A8C8HMV9_ONCTS
MVDWTVEERKLILETWGKIKVKVFGPLALRWSRYFGTFGDLNSALAIMGNKKVVNHGITNMDDVNNTYVELSVLHSERLHVDPDNFRMGRGFTPDVQAAWQKFLAVVVSALGRQYY